MAEKVTETEEVIEAEVVIEAKEVLTAEEVIDVEEVSEPEEVDEGEQIAVDVTTVCSDMSLFDVSEVVTADLPVVWTSHDGDTAAGSAEYTTSTSSHAAQRLFHCIASHSHGVDAYSEASDASRDMQGNSWNNKTEFAEAALVSSATQFPEEQSLDLQIPARSARLSVSNTLSPQELSMLCESLSAVRILIRSGSSSGLSGQPDTFSTSLRRVSSYPTLQIYPEPWVLHTNLSNTYPHIQAMLDTTFTTTPSCPATVTAAILFPAASAAQLMSATAELELPAAEVAPAAVAPAAGLEVASPGFHDCAVTHGTHDSWAGRDRSKTSTSASAGLHALSEEQAVPHGTSQASSGGVAFS